MHWEKIQADLWRKPHMLKIFFALTLNITYYVAYKLESEVWRFDD